MKKRLFILALCFCTLLTAFGQKKSDEIARVIIKGMNESRTALPLKSGDDFHICTEFSEPPTFSGKGYEPTEILYRNYI